MVLFLQTPNRRCKLFWLYLCQYLGLHFIKKHVNGLQTKYGGWKSRNEHLADKTVLAQQPNSTVGFEWNENWWCKFIPMVFWLLLGSHFTIHNLPRLHAKSGVQNARNYHLPVEYAPAHKTRVMWNKFVLSRKVSQFFLLLFCLMFLRI